MRVLRGAGVDPQRRLEHLDTLATFLQKLEGKTKAGRITNLCLIYGSMTRTTQTVNIWKFLSHLAVSHKHGEGVVF